MKIKYRREKANAAEYAEQLLPKGVTSGTFLEQNDLPEENRRLRIDNIKLKYDLEAVIYQHRENKKK